MTHNVIAFPKGKKNAPPQSVEEVIESMESIRKDHIEFLVDECCSFVFGRLMDEGFDLSDEKIFNESLLVVESLKAALYACSGISHPLHEVANQIFVFENQSPQAEPTEE
jgi:hypothetical protein